MTATATPSRPDLAAYDEAVRMEPDVIVSELRDLLGARLVAFLARVTETRAVHEWAEGERQIRSAETIERLRVAYRVAKLVTARDDARVAQAWFQGLNPKLGDRSPARLLRDGDLEEVGPGVLAAARAFAAVGSTATVSPDATARLHRSISAQPEDGTRLRIHLDRKAMESFCAKWKISELSFFGSVLTDEFGPDSDVDVLVTFENDARWGLAIVDMEEELAGIIGREVDLVTRDAVEESPNWIRRRSILEGSELYYSRR